MLLNTFVTITLYGTEDTRLIEDCFSLCREYELIFSRTDPDSELYRLNRLGEGDVSPALSELLTQALAYCRETDGAYDITMGAVSDLYGFSSDSPVVPEKEVLEKALLTVGYEKIQIDGSHVTLAEGTVIDLGSCAKGYIADRLAEYLLAQGQESAIIDLGGNILCVGTKPDGSDYTVGIRSPSRDSTETVCTVRGSNMSVVTSGIYERGFESDGVYYHHILDPKTGLPYDNGLVSVSIISESSVLCDLLSTACFALGPEAGMELIENTPGTQALFLTGDGESHASSGFAALLAESGT